ncbi:hypothetical protein JKP88DRAFT_353673 [Tribonema minus]|uniref:Uncharacterized protein n=1 Tax=Tribonema minus TaxID=303371 RepID=A0A835Z716_9STRA|nr:hypothetical protein JKP88DRAFT_353673 [Tribonema minus]
MVQNLEPEPPPGCVQMSNIEQDLASALKRLQKLVALDQRGQMQELRSPEGAGIMCWFAAAHPDLFLDPTNHSFVVPPYVLRWGVCGRAKFNGLDLVQFDTSVVQNGRDFIGTVTELRLRLGALRWLFDACVSNAKYFRLVETDADVPRHISSSPDSAIAKSAAL